MNEIAQELLDDNGFDDWEVIDDVTLCSPNGHHIEWDGVSPDGEVSPLRELGFI